MGTQVFARIETEAINDESAILRASSILDEHLMILNALRAGSAFLDSAVPLRRHEALLLCTEGRPVLVTRWDRFYNPGTITNPTNGSRSQSSFEERIRQNNQRNAVVRQRNSAVASYRGISLQE